MKHLLSIATVYGLLMSGITGSWIFIEYKATIEAFNVGSNHAELRHRINGWGCSLSFLLSNILTVAALSGRLAARHRD
jgi:hypothetical protein